MLRLILQLYSKALPNNLLDGPENIQHLATRIHCVLKNLILIPLAVADREIERERHSFELNLVLEKSEIRGFNFFHK
jgi:hypothetical protein